MSEFICYVCNYNTHDNTNYKRHITTKKHIKNMKLYSICEKCNYYTQNNVNYNRHLISKKHINNISIQNNNQLPVNDLIQLQNEKTELLMNEIKKLRELNEKNTNKINETNTQNTQKIVKEARVIKQSVLTMLNTHFKNTPSIEYIKQEPFFKALEEEYKANLKHNEQLLL